MDQLLFRNACECIIDKERTKNGIGTLSEKTLHAVLKHYFEPYDENHEKKIGGFVADIVSEKGIIEIQTRQFNKLLKKLQVFLEVCPVTVVYPVAELKWLCWINEDTGEVTKKRKSPKTGLPHSIFFELYKIKSLLKHPNLHICIVMLEVEEYRLLNGYSKNKKRGSTRHDSIPINILDEIYINHIHDYKQFLPMTLIEPFTTKDYKKATGLSQSMAGLALNILNEVEAVKRVGKQGNMYLYEISKENT